LFADSADWLPRAWQTGDGLPDNNISGICQNPDGFLWVGTDGGLIRFDGIRFEDFSRPLPGVPNRVIRAQVLDRRGRLWLGMDRGTVARVGSDGARVFSAADGLPDLRAAVMAEDGEGAVWIAYTGSSILCRIQDNEIRRFTAQEGLPAGGTAWVASDSKGQLWFAKGRAIGVFRDGSFRTLLTLEGLVTRITSARSGGVWICSGARLFRFEEGQTAEPGGELPIKGAEPSVLLEDKTGVLWIGTAAHGLFRCEHSVCELVGTSHPEISCLAEDREGNLWVGTRGGGLNQLRRRTLELVGPEPGRPLESIRSLCEDTGGSLWAVTQNGLVLRKQGADWSVISSGPDWPGGQARCVAAGADGAVWIGTQVHRLYCFEAGQCKTWSSRNGLVGDSIRSLLVSSAGDVWLGTDVPRRLERLHRGEFTNYELPSQARSVRAMAEDAAGNIWAATAEGELLRVSDDRLVSEPTNQLQHPLSIRCLHATPDGSLWIGYAGWGLGRLKAGYYSRITTAQGLNDDYISQILSDGKGWLWLAGNRGVFRVELDEVEDVAEGRAAHLRSVVYGRAEGLPSLQATYDNFPGAVRCRDERLRFPMHTGLLVVHTENIRNNPDPPPVFIEAATVDGKTLARYDSHSPFRESEPTVADLRSTNVTLQLQPNHRRLEFAFTAPSLSAPENVHFRYRLEGRLDEDWIEAGNERRAAYQRLAAGPYRFRVIACNESGIWNETGATLAITVLPFVWQTWWFRLGSLVAFTAAVVVLARYVSFRRLRARLLVLEQQAALDRERTRIAKDIHDDLGGSLTQVTMLLELALRDRAEPNKFSGHITQGLTAARRMLKSLDETVWAINPRNDTLPHLINYLGKFALRFLGVAEIRCRLDLPEHPPELPMPADVRHNLLLVVKEALNNVVRHGHASEVRLRVVVTESALEIAIEDNGCGFTQAPDDPLADGLRNMRQRMADLGGRCTIESQLGAGTKVTLYLPWPRRGVQPAPSG
jgi:ligand-binding sensor domain-containing protein/signal transduction histidine kinase